QGGGPCVGQDAVLSIILKNNFTSARSLALYSQVAAVYYTGVQKAQLKRDQTCINLKSYEGLGLQYVRTINYGDIESRATVNLTETFITKSHGPYKLLASLDCPQPTQVHEVGSFVIIEEKL
ncbi:putative protein-glutamine gamma-glutamyltransferase K-like, partial [Triplophysa rosa]